MACIRKRRGKWVVDYRDGAAIRRWVTCETRREAEAVLTAKLQQARQFIRPSIDQNISLAGYAERWLGLVQASIKPRTLASYRQTVRLHLVPQLGSTRICQLAKGR